MYRVDGLPIIGNRLQMNSEIYLVGSISIYSSIIIAQYYAYVYKFMNLPVAMLVFKLMNTVVIQSVMVGNFVP